MRGSVRVWVSVWVRARGPGRLVAGVLGLAACAAPGTTFGSSAGGGPAAVETLPPPGYGTLREGEVTVPIRAGPLQIRITPLAESVTRVTAPDTYRRLHALAETHASAGTDPERLGADLFLVSFFSEEPAVTFTPEDVQLFSRGLRVRHGRIVPVTPGWGERRLRQRETEMAVYAFPGVDLETELVFSYADAESAAWSVILPRVQAERARARARAGVT